MLANGLDIDWDMVNLTTVCGSPVMMTPGRQWTRDPPRAWMRPSLEWPPRWRQLSSTEVSSCIQAFGVNTTYMCTFLSSSSVNPTQQLTSVTSVFCRFCLHLQWTLHVWVQPGEQEAVPCAEEQLFLTLHQILDQFTALAVHVALLNEETEVKDPLIYHF